MYRKIIHVDMDAFFASVESRDEVSAKLHEIWGTYTDVIEYISLDEGYLDVTGSIRLIGIGVRNFTGG